MGQENRLYQSGSLAAALSTIENVSGEIAESLGKRRFDKQDKNGCCVSGVAGGGENSEH